MSLSDSALLLRDAASSLRRRELLEDKEKALAPTTKALERIAELFFAREGEIFLSELKRYRHLFPISEAAGPAGAVDDMYGSGAFDQIYKILSDGMYSASHEAALAGGWDLINQLGMSPDFALSFPEAEHWARENAAAKVTKIQDTTKERMRSLITSGVGEGWSYDRMATEIQQRFSGFAGELPQLHIQTRAHLVAVTENAFAYEHGRRTTVDRIMAEGIGMEKEWITVGDSRVSSGCRRNAAAGWIPVEESFPTGADNPPRFPGCRCCSGYQRAKVTKGKQLTKPTKKKRPPSKEGGLRGDETWEEMLSEDNLKALRDKVRTQVLSKRPSDSYRTVLDYFQKVAEKAQKQYGGSLSDIAKKLLPDFAKAANRLDLETFRGLIIDSVGRISVNTTGKLSKAVRWLNRYVSSHRFDYMGDLVTIDLVGAGRSNYSDGLRLLNWGNNQDPGAFIHEFAHHLDLSGGSSGRRVWTAFYNSRTRGERRVRMYGDEWTKGDSWFDRYVGRVYDSGPLSTVHPGTEVPSMGLELMYKNPSRLAERDPEHFLMTLAWMWGGF